MTGLPVQDVAQVAMERILNALPEGFLVAFFAWALLRVLPRQNSGTRFAVWFLALLTVAALPVLGSFGEGRILLVAGMSSLKSSGSSWGSMRPAITIPARWGLFAFLGWALGAGAAMLPLVAGLCRLRQLRRSCAEIDPADLDPLVRRTVDAIGRSGRVTVTTSECVRVPAAIGFFKRTIVLPAWVLRELPPSDLNVILLHEFAHLRRRDDWTNLIQKIVRALFFFHPAVWWIENRLSMEREMACDDAVLAETANPRGYATCLVSLLEKSLAHRLAHRMSHPRWSMAQAAVHRAREAALRLARILDTNRPVATRVWKPALAMVGAFSVICLLALPHAPQVVAFDRGTLAGNSFPAHSAAVSQPVSAGGPGTPARLDAQYARRRTPRPKPVAGRQLAHAQAEDARWNAPSPRARVLEASVSADQQAVPQVRTLVLIEATRYTTSDSSVWNVQVWRVILVSPVREQWAGVPVANKT